MGSLKENAIHPTTKVVGFLAKFLVNSLNVSKWTQEKGFYGFSPSAVFFTPLYKPTAQSPTIKPLIAASYSIVLP